jgi:cell division septum initiation protein DivIVA
MVARNEGQKAELEDNMRRLVAEHVELDDVTSAQLAELQVESTQMQAGFGGDDTAEGETAEGETAEDETADGGTSFWKLKAGAVGAARAAGKAAKGTVARAEMTATGVAGKATTALAEATDTAVKKVSKDLSQMTKERNQLMQELSQARMSADLEIGLTHTDSTDSNDSDLGNPSQYEDAVQEQPPGTGI